MGQINYDELLAFIMVAVALMGSPGPATLSLAAAGAAFDFKGSRRYLVGLTFSSMLTIVAVAAGIFTAISTIPYAPELLGSIGIIYIVYLAYKIATAPPVGKQQNISENPKFINGFMLGISNPKLYAAMAALFSGFQIIPQSSVQSTYLQVIICFLILWILNPIWLFMGSALRSMLHEESTSRLVNRSFSVLLIASVILVVML
jgi:threonine/homoserine/homoserine lactone efflux protein